MLSRLVAFGILVFAPLLSHALASAGMRVEESDPAMNFAGPWTASDSSWGWSGGSALQSSAAGATVSLTFVGTSIRWIGSRGRGMGIALVSVDGGPAREVDLFARPTDEIHSSIFTVSDLSNGQHTLTIEVTGRKNNEAQGNVVVIDALDVQPATTVSHLQDTDPDARFSAGWTKSSVAFLWSGSGVSNAPELPVTAQETETAGANVTLPFRGTGIAWVGYLGPDGGIAQVQVDAGPPQEVDLYSPTARYQPVVFSATALTDGNHTLTIQATGRRNPASTAARVVVDAFDVMAPGRRYEQYDPSITYSGFWTMDNNARVWTEGMSATSNVAGATATFRFTGTSVTWIGCRKGSAGGTARIYIDGNVAGEVQLSENYPIEAYQKPVFRIDGLADTAHTLVIEVISNTGSYVVVDAFDVVGNDAPPPGPTETATVSLASSSNPSMIGNAVTFTASISGSSGIPTGTATFLADGTAISGCAAVALAGGSASCTTSGLGAGSHAIIAQYSGDATYRQAESSTLAQSVQSGPTATATVSLASSSNPSTVGNAVTFSASISGSSGTPTGTTTFLADGTAISGCAAMALASGSATCTTSSLAAGSHAIIARYSGDATYRAADSSTLAQSVQSPQPGHVSVAPASLDFGGQSMGTTSPPQSVVVSNSSGASVTIDSVTVSGPFGQTNDCGTLAPGQGCTVNVTFSPPPSSGALSSTVATSGALSISSNSAGSTSVALAGVAEKSLVSHYYRSILRRAPDAGGKAFWQGESARMVDLGASVNEAWFATAMSFFNSTEYAAFARSDDGFVTDVYSTFFNREPDAGGLAFWHGQLAGGLPREVVLVTFMISPEFRSFTQAIFGNVQARPEVDMVMDFYRGLLARLPDSGGYGYWVERFRAAQCQGSASVNAQSESVSSSFVHGAEYGARARSNAQFVGDLYNAFLRRGGELDGVRYWIDELGSGRRSREEVRRAFASSAEFQGRVQAIVDAGCTP